MSVARTELWSGVLVGVGVVAFLDETVFHQLLHWHHFYDRSTADVGLVSDGVFHAFGFFALVGGLFMMADLRRRGGPRWSRWVGGILLGGGAFQLYDGTIHHKVLQLHQIRYGVDVVPYDLTWNITAAILILAGVVITVRTARPAASG